MFTVLAFIGFGTLVFVLSILFARAIECHEYRTTKNRRSADACEFSYTGPDRRRDTKQGALTTK